MREIFTRIEINSSADAVWAILTDLDSYPCWNPFIPEAKGILEPGASLRIKIKPAGRNAQRYRVRIVRIVEPREFSWLGHFHLPGLIDGEHHFEIQPMGPARVELIQRECFRGILVPLTWSNFLNTRLRAGFEALNQSLKLRAEAPSG